jgi:hypothetical protein
MCELDLSRVIAGMQQQPPVQRSHGMLRADMAYLSEQMYLSLYSYWSQNGEETWVPHVESLESSALTHKMPASVRCFNKVISSCAMYVVVVRSGQGFVVWHSLAYRKL